MVHDINVKRTDIRTGKVVERVCLCECAITKIGENIKTIPWAPISHNQTSAITDDNDENKYIRTYVLSNDFILSQPDIMSHKINLSFPKEMQP